MSSLVGRCRSRRAFLAMVLALVASGIPTVRGHGQSPGRLDRWLQELVADVPGAVALGRRYLEQYPADASAAALERALFGTGVHAAPARAGDRLIRKRIRDGRAADMRNGDLLVLRGWVLTRTEGRLLALLALRAA